MSTSMHKVGVQLVEFNINREMEEFFTFTQAPDGLTHAVPGPRVWVKSGCSPGYLGVGGEGQSEGVGPSAEGSTVVSSGSPWSVSKS